MKLAMEFLSSPCNTFSVFIYMKIDRKTEIELRVKSNQYRCIYRCKVFEIYFSCYLGVCACAVHISLFSCIPSIHNNHLIIYRERDILLLLKTKLEKIALLFLVHTAATYEDARRREKDNSTEKKYHANTHARDTFIK